MVELMAMVLVKAVRQLRLMVRHGDVARVLAVEPEPDRRRVVVMVVLIRRRTLRQGTLLRVVGVEVHMGSVVQVGGVGLVGDQGGLVGRQDWSRKRRTRRRFSSLAAEERSQQRGRGG